MSVIRLVKPVAAAVTVAGLVGCGSTARTSDRSPTAITTPTEAAASVARVHQRVCHKPIAHVVCVSAGANWSCRFGGRGLNGGGALVKKHPAGNQTTTIC